MFYTKYYGAAIERHRNDTGVASEQQRRKTGAAPEPLRSIFVFGLNFSNCSRASRSRPVNTAQ